VRRFAVAVALSSVGLAGCLLTIDDALVDRTDAGNVTADGGADRAAEASVDAGADAPTSGDAAPPDAGFVCPQGALFCDDFQSGTLAKWSVTNFTIGSVQLDPTRPGNRALRVTAPSNGNNDWSEHADVSIDLPATGDVTLTLKLLVTQSSGEIFPFGIFWGTVELAYRFGPPAKFVEQVSAPFNAYDVPSFTQAQWTTGSFVVHRSAGYVDATIGGVTKRVPSVGSLQGASQLGTTKLGLVLGVFYAPKSTSWSGWIDDVVVTSP
jgi:hypothetical protein